MLENDLQMDCLLATAATPPVFLQCAGLANPSGNRLEKEGARVGEIVGSLDGFKVIGVFEGFRVTGAFEGFKVTGFCEGFELVLVAVIVKRFL